MTLADIVRIIHIDLNWETNMTARIVYLSAHNLGEQKHYPLFSSLYQAFQR